MMIKTNYHTHTYLCNHAQGLGSDYIRLALEAGYTEIGISDHGPVLKTWTHRMSIDDFYDIYLPDLNEAILEFGTKIKIYKGLEVEYYPTLDKHYHKLLNSLDYLILGQHCIMTKNGLHDIYRNMTEELIAAYRDEVVNAMKTGLFKILAHPDIYLFNYQIWNDFTEQICHDIIEAAIKYNVLLEINVNGIRRGIITSNIGEETYIYPRIEFWRIVKQYPKAKVIIGEDNHAFKHVDDISCATARAFAANLGLNPKNSYLNNYKDMFPPFL